MSKYECPRCGYLSKFKSSFINHLKRKNICNPIVDDCSIEQICFLYNFDIHKFLTPNNSKSLQNPSKIPPNNSISLQNENIKNIYDLQCKFCLTIFSRKDNVTKHHKTCKVKKEYDEKKIMESQQLCLMKNEIETLKEKLDKTTTLITTNNNTSNNNSNNTQNINIHINNLGEENIKHIDYNYYNNILKGIYGAVPKLVEKIHFDNEHPENQNIKLTNKKEPYIKVRKKNKWKLANRKIEVLDLIDSKCFLLSEKYKKLLKKNHNLSDEQQDKIETFIEKYNEDNTVLIDDLMNKTELMLLNNS
jgi:hypothetical protein